MVTPGIRPLSKIKFHTAILKGLDCCFTSLFQACYIGDELCSGSTYECQGEITEAYGPIVEFLLSWGTGETVRETCSRSISQMKPPRTEVGHLL
jgi:hypothetical protein